MLCTIRERVAHGGRCLSRYIDQLGLSFAAAGKIKNLILY